MLARSSGMLIRLKSSGGMRQWRLPTGESYRRQDMRSKGYKVASFVYVAEHDQLLFGMVGCTAMVVLHDDMSRRYRMPKHQHPRPILDGLRYIPD